MVRHWAPSTSPDFLARQICTWDEWPTKLLPTIPFPQGISLLYIPEGFAAESTNAWILDENELKPHCRINLSCAPGEGGSTEIRPNSSWQALGGSGSLTRAFLQGPAPQGPPHCSGRDRPWIKDVAVRREAENEPADVARSRPRALPEWGSCAFYLGKARWGGQSFSRILILIVLFLECKSYLFIN